MSDGYLGDDGQDRGESAGRVDGLPAGEGRTFRVAPWPAGAAGPLLLRHLARARREAHGASSATAARLDRLAAWLDAGCPGLEPAPGDRGPGAPNARLAGPAVAGAASAAVGGPGSLPDRGPAGPLSDPHTDFLQFGGSCRCGRREPGDGDATGSSGAHDDV